MVDAAGLMTADDLGPLGDAPAGIRIAYGDDACQFGELSLPSGPGPHPLVINVHGGVWLAQYDLGHSRALAQALVASGLAVWNIEYRRVGNDGGGWPGTFLDVGRAADHVRELAKRHPVSLARVIAMGHSAGGHLALWLGARSRLPSDSTLRVPDPVALRGIVALAPATDLPLLHQRQAYDRVVDRLMGGSPVSHPERYDSAMPQRHAPLGVWQYLVVGRHDHAWGEFAVTYAREVRSAGDTRIDLLVAEDAGHFELISPGSSAWPLVVERAHRAIAAE
jgi:acetyl esterase/lipase